MKAKPKTGDLVMVDLDGQILPPSTTLNAGTSRPALASPNEPRSAPIAPSIATPNQSIPSSLIVRTIIDRLQNIVGFCSLKVIFKQHNPN